MIPAGIPELPTEEEVDASVAVNFKKLQDAHGDELTHMLNGGLKAIVLSKRPFHKKHAQIREIINRAADMVSPVSACKKGCSKCCNMAVTISSYDAKLIGDAIGRSPRIVPMRTEGMAEDYLNVPCTFLINNECSIYEHRPSPCRTHFNISNYPQLCDTANYNGTLVPKVNFEAVEFSLAAINFKKLHVFNDIRAFFPQLTNSAV